MIPIITSLSNPKLKSTARLKESRDRRKQNQFLVDGVREVFRAWQGGYRFLDVFLSLRPGCEKEDDPRPIEEKIGDPADRHYKDLKKFVQELIKDGVPITGVSESVFSKISFGDRNEGIVAVLEGRTTTFADLETLSDVPLIGVLEGIEKPGNVGAVFRSADGAGLDAMIIAAPGTDLYNPNTIRASLGTLFRIPTVIASSEETMDWLIRSKIQIASALCDSAVPYSLLDYTGPTAIVLGNEADGLTSIWSKDRESEAGICGIKIPMLGIADSLNISNAAAVLFYEARRQRQIANEHRYKMV
ncbi:MAG: TrmH family RNA methyltransferase [Planctomycetia bacterium]|nr:TrmH family RNA methyltransferase [Planctomycetia bacterium]